MSSSESEVETTKKKPRGRPPKAKPIKGKNKVIAPHPPPKKKKQVVKKPIKKKKVVYSSSESERSNYSSESEKSDVEELSVYSGSEDESRERRHICHSDCSEHESGSDREEEEDGRKEKSELGYDFELPDEKEPAKVWVMVGVPASGKSYMLRYIFYLFGQRKYFKGGGMCFSPSAYNGDYDFLPEKAVRDKFDLEWLGAYIEHLKAKVKEGKAKNGKDWKLPHNFLILDDNLGTLNTNSEILQQLFACHRHISCSIFICTQYLAAARNVSTLMRNVTNYALMWPQSLKNSIESMYNAYGQMFETIEAFKGALNKAREDKYSCLLYINSTDLTSSKEAYRIIKAGEFPEFKLKFGKKDKDGEEGEMPNELPDQGGQEESHHQRQPQIQHPQHALPPRGRHLGRGNITKRRGWSLDLDDDFEDL